MSFYNGLGFIGTGIIFALCGLLLSKRLIAGTVYYWLMVVFGSLLIITASFFSFEHANSTNGEWGFPALLAVGSLLAINYFLEEGRNEY